MSPGWRQGECWFFLERRYVRGGSWRREPSLRKEHGRKRLKESAADVGVEEKAGKGVCPYGEEDTDSVRCERKG